MAAQTHTIILRFRLPRENPFVHACDGYEHREQTLGVVGPLSHTLSVAVEICVVNTDVIIMANGTDRQDRKRLWS
jgi:hypothetical protein